MIFDVGDEVLLWNKKALYSVNVPVHYFGRTGIIKSISSRRDGRKSFKIKIDEYEYHINDRGVKLIKRVKYV